MPLTSQALADACEQLNIEIAPFDFKSLQIYALATMTHKDPFDRALVAQSLATNIPLITADQALLQLNSPNLITIHA